MRDPKINKRKLYWRDNPFRVWRRVTASTPWRLLAATNLKKDAEQAFARAQERFAGQEVRLEGVGHA